MTGDDPKDPQGGDNVVDLKAVRAEQAAERVAGVLDQAEDKGKKPGDKAAGKVTPPTRGVRAIVGEMLDACKIITDDSGSVYLYADGAWAPLSEQRQLAMVHRMKPGMSATMRRDAVAYLKAETYRENLQWGRVAEWEIPCANGVLDVRTLKMRDHRAEDLLQRVLPIAWDPTATCARWLEALAFFFPPATDGGRLGALQEFFGYICLAHAKYKKALFLYGKPNTGKSLAVLLAKKMVGEKFCCTIGVEHMDDPSRVAVIEGKALNVITEVSADALIADGGFKTLVSTEEPIFIDAKYLAPKTITPTTKHAIVANSLPKLNDQTSATFDRLLIIPYDRVLTEADQDRGLLAALVAELPGILVWAAAGARRLVDRGGQWPDVAAARAVLDEYRSDLNPMRQFVAENMAVDERAIVPLSRVATAFNKWNSGGRHFSVKYVGRMLRAAGFEEHIRKAKHDGRTVACLRGWRLVAEAPAQLFVKAEPKDDGDLLEAVEARPADPAADRVAARAADLEEAVP